jgi:hypothetical protein
VDPDPKWQKIIQRFDDLNVLSVELEASSEAWKSFTEAKKRKTFHF